MKTEEIILSIKNARRPVSMDAPLATTPSNRLMDVLKNNQLPEPDTDVMKDSLTEEVNEILKGLSDRESRILTLYYGLNGEKPHTLEEVGVKFKLTRERVRQIKVKALEKLRNKRNSSALKIYL
jgi:RNA polymerase primary sigma factor